MRHEPTSNDRHLKEPLAADHDAQVELAWNLAVERGEEFEQLRRATTSMSRRPQRRPRCVE